MLKSAGQTEAHAGHDIPAGFEIPGMEVLTQPASMLEVINGLLPAGATPFEQCDLVNLRFKNPTSCLITYRLTTAPGDSGGAAETYVYARGFGRPQFAAAVPQLATTRWVESDWGPSVSVVPDASAILYWFPNDERLHGLRRITINKKLQRVLYDHLSDYPADQWRISDRSIRRQILRYKPERRIVMRCRFRAHRHADGLKHERFVYIGVYEEGRDQQLWRVLSELSEHATHSQYWTVPTVLARVREHGMLISEELRGPSLRAALDMTEPDTDLNETIALVARALHELHGTRVSSVPSQGHVDTIRSLDDARDRLVRFIPDSEGAVTALAAELSRRVREMPTENSSFVHGDLHPGQVILGDERVGFIDFDRAHIGDPIEDIGNFCAQLWLNYSPGIAADITMKWIEEYRRVSTVPVTEYARNVWTAVALFESALRPVGRLEPHWRRTVTSILEQTEAVLG